MNEQTKELKWISLQPLTGGMYLGFEKALGKPAECIISYPGLNSYSVSKQGKPHAGNEYNLTEYLRKVGRAVPRYEFSQGMFEENMNVELTKDEYSQDAVDMPDFSGVDIVCAVPVCSGLSSLSSSSKEVRENRNCNMKFLARYALEVIKPTVYVFENAPGFMGKAGEEMRAWFEELGKQLHYSVSYFKTNTRFHHNCQKRIRTFVVMTKWNSDTPQRSADTPFWEDVQLKLKDVLEAIPADAAQQDVLPDPLFENEAYMTYVRERYPENWREWLRGDVMVKIIKRGLTEDFRKWCQETTSIDRKFADRMLRLIDKIAYNRSLGKGWWSVCPKYYDDYAPAIQSRTVYILVHPTEERLMSERDLLTLMGLPYDYDFQGDFMNEAYKIGQNVPVNTAAWIAKIAQYCCEHANDEREIADDAKHARFYDNTKKIIVY